MEDIQCPNCKCVFTQPSNQERHIKLVVQACDKARARAGKKRILAEMMDAKKAQDQFVDWKPLPDWQTPGTTLLPNGHEQCNKCGITAPTLKRHGDGHCNVLDTACCIF